MTHSAGHRAACNGYGPSMRTNLTVEDLRGADVIVRIEPGHVRAWDYADEFGSGGG